MAEPLADAAEAVFARHETFAPRFGWLHKGFTAADADPGVFSRDDATVALGVGQNQVRAIRYWLGAFKLTEKGPPPEGQRAASAVPTWEANWLFSENGADPYLEDPASLWILHHWLLSPPCQAPTWWVAFNATPSARLSEEELAELVVRKAEASGWKAPSPESVRRDISCLTSMYAHGNNQTGAPRASLEDDLMTGQFRELGLLTVDEPGSGRKLRFGEGGSWAGRPDEVVAYACVDYAARTASAARTISIGRLASEPGAPGRAFRMTAEDLTGSLRRIGGKHPGISVADSVGYPSLVFSDPPGRLAWDVLAGYYGNVQVPTREQWAARRPAAAVRPRRTSSNRGRRARIHPGQVPLWGPAEIPKPHR